MSLLQDAKELAAPAPRLIIVCGLPGAGKTTLAKVLARRLRAIRFCADDWMAALALDLYDEGAGRRSEEMALFDPPLIADVVSG